MFAPSNFLNLDQTEHRTIFDNSAQVWDVLKQIGSYLQFRLKPAVYARVMGRPFISENVYIGGGTVIENGATIKGPGLDRKQLRNTKWLLYPRKRDHRRRRSAWKFVRIQELHRL